MSDATFSYVTNTPMAGATAAGGVTSVIDFDIRPIVFNLERIAAAIEKVQLRVDIPEMHPVFNVPPGESPRVQVDFKAPDVKPTIEVQAAPIGIMPAATVVVQSPVWPSLVLVVATILQIAAACGLFK